MSAVAAAPHPPLSAASAREATLDYLRAHGEPDLDVRTTVIDNPSTERLVAACEVLAPAGAGRAGQRFIVKVFGDDGGARTWTIMRALEEALARRGSTLPILQVPRALGYDAARRCLIQECVEAIPFPALDTPAARAEAMQAAGVALAELHTLDLPALPVRNFDEHVTDLIRPHPEALAARCPELAVALRTVLDGCGAATAGAELNLPAVLHRDLHPRQLFLDQRRVWVIDWDLAAAGDPALDVGNFVTLLELKYGPDCLRLAEAFLAGYATRSAGWPALRTRLPGWQATAYLRRACKAVRLNGVRGHVEARHLLDIAERLLAGCGRAWQ